MLTQPYHSKLTIGGILAVDIHAFTIHLIYVNDVGVNTSRWIATNDRTTVPSPIFSSPHVILAVASIDSNDLVKRWYWSQHSEYLCNIMCYKTVSWYCPMHKEGNDCVLLIRYYMCPCFRSVRITFTVRAIKQSSCQYNFLKSLLRRIIEAQSVVPS